MRAREEFQENSRVYREVPANPKTPEGCKAPDGGEIRGPCCDETEHSRDAEGSIEGPSSTEDITTKAPEHGSGEEANILGERQERRVVWEEFVRDWSDCYCQR